MMTLTRSLGGLGLGLLLLACGGNDATTSEPSKEAPTPDAASSVPGDGGLPDAASDSSAPGATPVGRLAAGFNHTCLVTPTNAVKCWGQSPFGTTTTAVVVPGLSAVRLALGFDDGCAITPTGTLKCWGPALGSSPATRSVPADVGLTDVTDVSVSTGYNSPHVCAIAQSETKCWGSNSGGQIGNGAAGDYSVKAPASVIGLFPGSRSVAAGYGLGCSVASGGIVTCWGFHAQMNIPASTDAPVFVPGLKSGVRTIVLGGYGCALMDSGGIKCWDDFNQGNHHGQLGNGTFESPRPNGPQDVTGFGPSSRALAVGVGSQFACALTETRGVKCWGARTLGNGGTADSNLPVDVVGIATAVDLAVDTHHACALLESGAVKCWGDNWSGELGNGTTNASLVPVDVLGL
jgi:alpha-tubulin suppressor-like RCC1 family protein